ncbi:RNA-directed DNA polymerase, eukaryota [Tanacetum coccineum]
MGSFRSKEDDVSKISTSIFVTNFPDSLSAKDIFHSCKQYGHVVDSFIPTKRTKDGSHSVVDGQSQTDGLLVNLKKALCIEVIDVGSRFAIWENFGYYQIRYCELKGGLLNFVERRRKDELSVEDNYDGKINDLEANNGIDESDVEEVLETLFSKDPFGLYPLLNKENIELARKDGASRISLRSLNPKENLGLIDEFYVFERSRPCPKGQKRLGIDLMRVVIYAPQEAKEKRMLWDYLAHVSNQWVGKLAYDGAFNEWRL